MRRIYFDVGANDGESGLRYARADTTNNIVYAFEPTPRLADIIKRKTDHLSNYHLIQKAVADKGGVSPLYISGHADWGCTSLCTFNDNLQHTWPGREDFGVTDVLWKWKWKSSRCSRL